MLQKILILSLYIAGTLTAPNNRPSRVCGSHRTDEQIEATEARFASYLSRQPTNTTGAQVLENVTIPVYWHVLAGGNAPSEGNTTARQISDSIDVMNEKYSGTGFSFELVNTTRTRNPIWWNAIVVESKMEEVVKGALRQGGANALNIYTASFKNVPSDYQGLLGYATFPTDYVDNPILDGVVVQYQTLPGGALEPFNLGITLVHETGHWLGLYHTFQGGCRGSGDMVADTPPQRSASSGCPVNRDSCPGGGKDPIRNYMDYSDDDCLSEFTPGQISRMQSFWSRYRDVVTI